MRMAALQAQTRGAVHKRGSCSLSTCPPSARCTVGSWVHLRFRKTVVPGHANRLSARRCSVAVASSDSLYKKWGASRFWSNSRFEAGASRCSRTFRRPPQTHRRLISVGVDGKAVESQIELEASSSRKIVWPGSAFSIRILGRHLKTQPRSHRRDPEEVCI